MGAGCGRRDPAIPWVPHGPGSRQAGTTPNPSAHIPSRNSGGSPHSGHPRAVTYFPVSPRQPQPQPRRRPPGPQAHRAPPVGRRPEIPAVKMQRAKRALQTMVPWCAVPSSATDRALGARPAPPLPRWRPWEPGGEGGSARSGSGCSGEGRRSETSAARLRQRRVLRRPARFCSIPAARAWAASAAAPAPAKPLPPRPHGADKATPWPPLSRRSGPGSLGPGRPLLDREGARLAFGRGSAKVLASSTLLGTQGTQRSVSGSLPPGIYLSLSSASLPRGNICRLRRPFEEPRPHYCKREYTLLPREFPFISSKCSCVYFKTSHTLNPTALPGA